MIVNDIMSKNFVKVDKNDVLSKMIGKFRSSKIAEAVIMDGKKYYGTLCKKKMIRGRIDITEEKAANVAEKPAVLSGTEELEEAARLMCASDSHMLPVAKKGILQGVVYAIDILKELKPLFAGKNVEDFASKKVIAFDQHTSVGKAMAIMRQKKISHAPIVTPKNKLSGVVSISDIIMKYELFPLKRAGGHNVRAKLSRPGKKVDMLDFPVINEAVFDVVTITRQDSIAKAIDLMAKSRISDVVIIDEYNQPAGMLTIKDLLRKF